MRGVLAILAAGGLALATALPAREPAAIARAQHLRVLPLEGGRNFRDLGGYRTVDGRHVRWGRLYRSGAMAGLTAGDYAYLDRLGIRSVCDLRTADERKAEPTVWGGARKPDYWTSDLLTPRGDLGKVLAPGSHPTPEAVREAMKGLYRALPESHAAAFREIFRRLDAGEVPLAFNCTAGKDRTGAAAALILSALRVPRATIVEDYAMSDKVVDYRKVFADKASPLSRLPPELAEPLLRSDPAYIAAMLDSIDARWGSVDAYLLKELGVDKRQLARMRARLTA